MVNIIIMKKSNLINLRVWLEIKKKMQEKADQFTGGNISEWLRMSGTQYTPRKIKSS